MARVKEFKRYANRRLYDAESSKTVTLEDVADCIKEGHEVRVIDNNTGRDITGRVLGQTFLKLFVDDANPEFSNFLLTSLIREISSDISAFFSRLIQSGIGGGLLTRERLEIISQKMVESGHLEIAEKNDYLGELLAQLRGDAAGVDSRASEGRGILREELKGDRVEKIEELSTRLDEMARLLQDMRGD